MELCVAVMLILLGTLNLSEALRNPNGCLDARASRSHEHTHTSIEHSIRPLSLRP
jgi:hypothetical protein